MEMTALVRVGGRSADMEPVERFLEPLCPISGLRLERTVRLLTTFKFHTHAPSALYHFNFITKMDKVNQAHSN